MPERRIVQIEAPIAELAHFNKQMLIHELIRGSLGLKLRCGIMRAAFVL
jgi:hypothetical protein